MTDKIFHKFKQIFTERCNRIPLLHIGEDSIRYDFFSALAEAKNLNPWDIQLENAIDKQAFIQRNNAASKRGEKPQMDLVVDVRGLRICVEFGMFRQNSNEDGQINKTARTVINKSII